MYDTLLFGNGLSIALLNRYDISFIGFNEYAIKFLDAQDKSSFYTMLGKNLNIPEIQRIEGLLSKELSGLLIKGFESWAGSFVFENKYFPVDFAAMTNYLYALYNWWYQEIFSKIVQPNLKFIETVNKIKALISGEVYTLNFDMYLDENINIKHLHGRFVYPLNSFAQITYFTYNDDNNHEFAYLFGVSGIDKQNRLKRINKYSCVFNERYYDLDFLFNENIKLGHLLIYGISFSPSSILSPEFEELHDGKYNDLQIVKSVDGHIVDALNRMFINGKINGITIAYFSQEDKKHYESIFNKNSAYLSVGFIDCIKYIDCKELDII